MLDVVWQAAIVATSVAYGVDACGGWRPFLANLPGVHVGQELLTRRVVRTAEQQQAENLQRFNDALRAHVDALSHALHVLRTERDAARQPATAPKSAAPTCPDCRYEQLGVADHFAPVRWVLVDPCESCRDSIGTTGHGSPDVS